MVRADRAKSAILAAALLVAVGALPARPAAADTHAAERVTQGGEELLVIAGVPRNWPPQYNLDADGKPAGFAIDVMDAIAARAGVRVIYKVYKGFSGITARLRAGDIDLIPNAGIAPHRKKTMLFTPPVETFVISLFVRRDTIDIKGFSDIEGHTIAVIGTNLAGRMLKKRAGLDLKVFTDARVALFELVAGHVDALAYPRPIILKLAREAGILNRIRPVGEPLVEVKRGIAVRLGATALRDRLSRAVEAFVKTPEYRRIYVKWYGQAKPFWTARRMGWTMSGAMVALFLIMAVWRHVSLLRVNRKLVANISQRIEAQSELEESEERYRSLAELMPEAVLVTNYGTILFCNPAAVRLFGAENADRLIGLDQSKLVHAEDRPRLRARIDQGPELRPLSSMMELRRSRLDGSEFFSESRSAPFV